jgi:lipoprotein-anchoring transpeptidase ErfK/SrfK
MKRRQCSAEASSRAPRARSRIGWGLLVLAFSAAAYGGVTQWGASAQVKLSESSHQAAYPAGLGPHRVSSVRLTRRVASAGAGCRATSPVGSRRNAYAALVKQTAVIRRTPNAHSSVVTELGPVDVNGLPQVLGVIGVHSNARCAADWYRVQLAVVPNGTVGWVRAWAVRTFQVRSRIVIDLSERSLRLYRSGKLILETPVAVGASATPTPRGRYFVNERYELPDSRGPFGPAALGISAHSNVLQRVWVQDGPIGIHGTNEPWSIGRAASHGCIRVANTVMRRLFRLAPAGTPIVVRT